MVNNPTLQILSNALQWLQASQPVVLVTVVKTWGSAPRPVGALMAVNAQGQFSGSISGGCIEESVIERVQNQQFQQPTTLEYGISDQQSQQLGLACGGKLTLLAEPLHKVDSIAPAVTALQQRQVIARRLDITTGQITWQNLESTSEFVYDGQQLINIFGPLWHLILIGAGQIARSLAEFALSLDYQVTLCDPRQTYAENWQVPGTQLDHRMPDDVVKSLVQDNRCAVITLSHSPKLDDLALMEALNSPAFYVGALGSKKTAAQRYQRLQTLGLTEAQLKHLHSPVGLNIGSRQPTEIALSIIAEITAVKNQQKLVLAA